MEINFQFKCTKKLKGFLTDKKYYSNKQFSKNGDIEKMKKILIVFPYHNLSFSPSTLNLYDSLSNLFDVTILSGEPDSNYSSQKISNKKIIYIHQPGESYFSLFRQGLKKVHIEFGLKIHNYLLSTRITNAVIHEIKKFDGEIIAVDFFALWCVKMANKKAHLLSLEVYENDLYKNSCSVNDIKSVIIQSDERYKFLFGDQKIKTFFVQNSPNYVDEQINFSKRNKTDLIFCGSAVPGFGIFNCLEFLEDFPEYRLTIKGAVPPNVRTIIEEYFSDLLEQNRLVIDSEYLSPSELNSYVAGFRIGFVFYDYLRFESINTFNYKTAPSGKLFQYYNAGVPVISNVPGSRSIKDYQTGVIIKSLGSVAIKNAIDQIEINYENYAKMSKKMSAHFDFSKNILEFVNYLKELN
jgi:glycosyltransferase involved in cell wall biosynthesis